MKAQTIGRNCNYGLKGLIAVIAGLSLGFCSWTDRQSKYPIQMGTKVVRTEKNILGPIVMKTAIDYNGDGKVDQYEKIYWDWGLSAKILPYGSCPTDSIQIFDESVFMNDLRELHSWISPNTYNTQLEYASAHRCSNAQARKEAQALFNSYRDAK